jgi:hypothetical protein
MRFHDPVFDDNPQTVKGIISTGFFYVSLLLGQRIFGTKQLLRLHVKSLPISLLFRIAVVGGAAATTQKFAYPLYNVFLHDKKRVVYKEKIRRGLLTVCSYLLLEQVMFPGVSPFKTALPSSVTTTGSYASMFGGAIPSTSSVATSYQRSLIQRMGRIHGCHHCGSRQIIGYGKYFIADHMPPTKLAELYSRQLWRRMLNLRVVQQLRPQCLDCFSVQGNAVRKNIHLAVFHYTPRLAVLSPLLATWLIENEYFGKKLRKLTNPLVASCVETYRELEEKMDR